MSNLEIIILCDIIVVQTRRDVGYVKANFINFSGRYRRFHHTLLHLDVCFRQNANVFKTFVLQNQGTLASKDERDCLTVSATS